MVFKECSDIVEAALHEDAMKSVKYMVELLGEEEQGTVVSRVL